jgi:hypothetical protein
MNDSILFTKYRKVFFCTVWFTSIAWSHILVWIRLQMGKVIVVIILYVFLSAPLRLESKLIVAACRDASVIRKVFDTNAEFFEFVSKISLASSLKRADRNTYKMMTTITLPICNLIHLCLNHMLRRATKLKSTLSTTWTQQNIYKELFHHSKGCSMCSYIPYFCCGILHCYCASDHYIHRAVLFI